MKGLKIRALIGLAIVICAVLFNLTWLWGVLFLLWVIPDIISGITYFFEPLTRKENPILYWLTIGTWVLLSLFILVDEFAPQILPNGWSSQSYQNYAATENGNYQIDFEQHAKEETILKYKNFNSPSFNVVGISAETTHANGESSVVLQQLWEAFLKDDISQVIPDIIDDKVYLVYSDYKGDKFNATIGYKTQNLNNIYKGLTGVSINASKYAVFEVNDNLEKNIPFTWEKIEFSDLKRAKTNDVEIYHYDAKTQDFYKADILVSLPTSKQETSSFKRKAPAAKPNKIITQNTNQDYTISTPKESPLTTSTENYTKEEIEAFEKQYPLHKHSVLNVVGLQTMANPYNEAAFAKAVEKLWEDFYKKDYARFINDIKSPNDVYVVYHNYTDKSAMITLGYQTKSTNNFKKDKGLKSCRLKSNDYYKFQLSGEASDFESEEWDALYSALEYRDVQSGDFEIYTFNKKYDITDAQMWVGAK